MSTTDFVPPPFPTPEPPSAPEPKSKRLRWALLAGLGVALIGLLGWSLTPSTFDMEGTYTLAQMAAVRTGYASDNCTGNFWHPSVEAGAAVTVKDADGKVIATSVLRDGVVTGALTCEFGFTVPGVPADSKFYSIEIAHTGEVIYPEDKAKTPALSLGF
jgi:hypothetical protein